LLAHNFFPTSWKIRSRLGTGEPGNYLFLSGEASATSYGKKIFGRLPAARHLNLELIFSQLQLRARSSAAYYFFPTS
jgi:hypothetical protein